MALYHKWDVKNGFSYVLTFFSLISDGLGHGLWTPNEGINQRYLKNWADVADKKYALAIPKYLGLGLNFRPCNKDHFLSGRP